MTWEIKIFGDNAMAIAGVIGPSAQKTPQRVSFNATIKYVEGRTVVTLSDAHNEIEKSSQQDADQIVEAWKAEN